VSDSNIGRLLSAFRIEPVDRVPNLEFWVTNQEIIEGVLNRRLDYNIYSEKQRRVELGMLRPEDAIEFAENIGMDAVGIPFSWRPGVLYGKASDGSLHYIGGALKEPEDLRSVLDQRPETETQLVKLEQFLKAADSLGTKVGIYAKLTTFFDSTMLAMGYENFMFKLYDNPGFVEKVMEEIFQVQYQVLQRLVQYDELAFIFVADDVAQKDGLMIHPTMFRRLFFSRQKAMVDETRRSNKLFVYHTDGDLREVIPILIELGVSGIQPIEPTANDIVEIKHRYGDRISLIGNIETELLAYGTEEKVRERVRERIEKLAPGGGYVLGSSSSIMNGAKLSNFLAMLEAGREFGRY
jgi:uroporphyrinogen-III decarboxylase